MPSSSIVSNNAVWSCEYCTFENGATNANCEMCGLPKSVQ